MSNTTYTAALMRDGQAMLSAHGPSAAVARAFLAQAFGPRHVAALRSGDATIVVGSCPAEMAHLAA